MDRMEQTFNGEGLSGLDEGGRERNENTGQAQGATILTLSEYLCKFDRAEKKRHFLPALDRS